MGSIPTLVVDLDNTLIRTDILYESFWDCAAKKLKSLIVSVLSSFPDRALLKRRLSEQVQVQPATLNYNEAVLDYVRKWRSEGGRTVLATATDETVARSIADHLQIFDEVHGSDGVRNLKGKSKADFLVERYGAGNYDYIGDSQSDLPVWKMANRAITVGLSDRVRAMVSSRSGEVVHLEGHDGRIGPYVKALRPHQWSKNVLVFLPLVTAHMGSFSAWTSALLAFICFNLVASSVYVLNDLLDLSADRAHPRKRKRPLASGALRLEHGTIMAPALLLLGLFFALLVGRLEFLGVMVLYYVATMAYSLSLKRKLIIDICALAGLYTLRIFAGAAATGLPTSQWLLAFSIFFFFSLAAVKRQAELVDAVASGRMKASGRGYHGDDLNLISMMALASGYVAVLVLALYFDSPTVRVLYDNPLFLWGICPVLLYWVSRMVMMTHRGLMDDDPIVFAVKDRISRYCGALVIVMIVLGAI